MSRIKNRVVKHGGQVFTPIFLVKNILDNSGYTHGNILQKHIIDNSCGNGAFLCEIVERYCNEYLSLHGNSHGLKNDLENFIHGIEIEIETYNSCIRNLDDTVKNYGIEKVEWDILNANALSITKYDYKMDYVVGNPPYVRVHNLEDDYDLVKSFHFAQDGMTDLYLVFFELGFRMLNHSGRLCYITPSSWLSSLAATNLRRHILTERKLVSLIDLGHYQAFENATTYTIISLFDKNNSSENIKYYTYSPEKLDNEFIGTFTYDQMAIGNNFYIATSHDLNILRSIKTSNRSKLACVKNGFATLADKVFITNVNFDNLTIPILKASTGKWYRGFFPYDNSGKPLTKQEIFSYPEIAEYLNNHKSDLLKNKDEQQFPDWYLYGRTQALKDVFSTKYSINSIVKDIDSIKLIDVPEGSGLYSGLYILTDVPRSVLEQIIKSNDFINYLKMLKNYKSGGYYTYSSKDLEEYLNYKLSEYAKTNHLASSDKLRISKSCFKFV